MILLLGFFLRSHNVLALPGYADESHHIRRAEVAWDFTVDNYASYTPGKLLLYYYLGLFEAERIPFLAVSRLAIALISLLGGAGTYAVGKRLFEPRIAIMGLFLYMVMPFTMFFDRMALADPLTLAMLMLATWGILIWLDKPTLKLGVILGILLILPPLAKLTAMAIIAAPIGAVWIYRRQHWREYIPSGLVALGILAIFWIPLFLPVILGEIRGDENRVVLVGDYLLNIHEEDQGFLENLANSIWEAFRQTAIYYWTPALILTGIGWLVLLWRRKHGLFLAVMLVLAWLPSVAVGSYPSTRYLEIGIPFLILMLVAGLYEAARSVADIDRQAVLERSLMLGFIIYSLSWSLPFFDQAVTNPADLKLPEDDLWRYVQSTTAGYGQQAAAHYLENQAIPNPESGQVEAYGILGSCHLMRLFMPEFGKVHLTCAPLETGRQLSPETIAAIATEAQKYGEIYLLLEPSLESNTDDLPLSWTLVESFQRPHEGVVIELWRVRPQTTNALPS
jgi:4-amino-4-deoxy-L-arabinose transferase-like glycosyltransferase